MTSFSLGSACSLSKAEEIHAALCEHMLAYGGQRLVIDATAVDDAGVSLAQILVAAARTAAARDAAMILLPSPAVSALLARAGLADWAESVRA